MTVSPVDPLWFKEAQAGVWEYASRDLNGLFRSLNLGNPKRARDTLFVEVPQLTSAYGEQTASLAVDWYDELRYLEGVPGRYRASMAPTFPEEFVRKRLRFGAGHLFTETPQLMLPFLLDAAQEYVLQPGRDTILHSVAEDRAAKGWERVTSPDACDFCQRLSGRFGKTDWVNYPAHGNCNCSAVPFWD